MIINHCILDFRTDQLTDQTIDIKIAKSENEVKTTAMSKRGMIGAKNSNAYVSCFVLHFHWLRYET